MKIRHLNIDNSGASHVKKCSPSSFNYGDLVQADISFILFKNNQTKVHTVQMVLRAITLMDIGERQVR